MKIILELSEDHARVVRDACELLMRMKLGQYNFPAEILMGLPSQAEMPTDEYCLRRELARDVMRAYLSVVGCKEGEPKDEAEKLAYEVWGTIRHAEWAREQGDTWDVRCREPLHESKATMPICKVVG